RALAVAGAAAPDDHRGLRPRRARGRLRPRRHTRGDRGGGDRLRLLARPARPPARRPGVPPRRPGAARRAEARRRGAVGRVPARQRGSQVPRGVRRGAGQAQGKRGRMDLVIHARFLTQRVTGVERYAREVTPRVAAALGSDRVVGIAPRGAADAGALGYPVVTAGATSGHLWEQLELPRLRPDARALLWS